MVQGAFPIPSFFVRCHINDVSIKVVLHYWTRYHHGKSVQRHTTCLQLMNLFAVLPRDGHLNCLTSTCIVDLGKPFVFGNRQLVCFQILHHFLGNRRVVHLILREGANLQCPAPLLPSQILAARRTFCQAFDAMAQVHGHIFRHVFQIRFWKNIGLIRIAIGLDQLLRRFSLMHLNACHPRN
ncbi:hypothetical protein DFQ00_104163 [Paenibacillus barcinonensis]|uniref:Uncharacterized protein n=1 Tax=Paenibacillus barcinonensis TaxID=198119 RepID=A0A2V4VL97_PAEBA|nr:hypothetical protein DFQ00_104163 [Paenibacillus barcinonensis]